MIFEWHIFLWHITLGVLLVYMLFSVGLYLTLRRKMFAYYSLSLFFILFYLFDKNAYQITLDATPFTRNLNWYLQIIYHFTYFWFCFEFLSYFRHLPYQKKNFTRITFSILILGTLMFGFTTAIGLQDMFLDYFLFFHVPIAVICFAVIIYNAFKIREQMKLFFIPGIIFYIGFSLAALIQTFNPPLQSTVEPITWFYLALLIETTMFSLGLWYFVKITFEQNLQYQKKLNKAQLLVQDQLQSDLAEIEFANDLERLKIDVLRNKLNSHFIFNVLNSLKTYIISNDSSAAVVFLNKYAKLMRLYLNASEIQTHSVSNEIKAAQLYAEVENHRLNNFINFNFHSDNSANLFQYELPAHVLIPFVEYSIRNGLPYTKNQKELHLKTTETGDKLLIEICDNGHYNGIKNELHKDDESLKGIAIAKKHIALYNSIHLLPINLTTEYNSTGGTVRLTLPKIVSES